MPAGAGTQASPFVVDTLPFVDAGDTSESNERAIDRYSCSTSNEAGAEVWYELILSESRTLRMAAYDAEDGVDVDLHILRGGKAGNNCLRRDNRIFDPISLDAGTYYVVVDTYTSSSSGEKPGLFSFFIQDVPQYNATACWRN